MEHTIDARTSQHLRKFLMDDTPKGYVDMVRGVCHWNCRTSFFLSRISIHSRNHHVRLQILISHHRSSILRRSSLSIPVKYENSRSSFIGHQSKQRSNNRFFWCCVRSEKNIIIIVLNTLSSCSVLYVYFLLLNIIQYTSLQSFLQSYHIISS